MSVALRVIIGVAAAVGLSAGDCLAANSTPRSRAFVIWEPAAFQFAEYKAGDTFKTRLEEAGYTMAYRYQDTTQDDDYSPCSRQSWNGLVNGVGLVFIESHGGWDWSSQVPFVCAAFGSEANCTEWRADDGDMKVRAFPTLSLYSVHVNRQWAASNWSTAASRNKVVFFVGTCASADPPGGLNWAASVVRLTLLYI